VVGAVGWIVRPRIGIAGAVGILPLILRVRRCGASVGGINIIRTVRIGALRVFINGYRSACCGFYRAPQDRVDDPPCAIRARRERVDGAVVEVSGTLARIPRIIGPRAATAWAARTQAGMPDIGLRLSVGVLGCQGGRGEKGQENSGEPP